jgi:glutathione S-transferase
VPTLYDHPASANAYKPRLLLSHLGLPYERVIVEIFGPDRADVLLPLSPIGRVPVWETDDGSRIAESAAILAFLAEDGAYLPDDRLARAGVWQWLAFEQNVIEANIAVLRFMKLTGRAAGREEVVRFLVRGGQGGLDALSRRLSDSPFAAGDGYTIADMALYAYVHVAPEAGFELSAAIREWIARVEAQPGFVEDLAPFPSPAG